MHRWHSDTIRTIIMGIIDQIYLASQEKTGVKKMKKCGDQSDEVWLRFTPLFLFFFGFPDKFGLLPIIVFLCLSTFFPLSPNFPRPTLLCCTYIPFCFTYSTVTGVIGPGSINSRDSIARGTQITIIQKDEPDTELVVADPSLCGVCNGGSDCRCVCLDRAPSWCDIATLYTSTVEILPRPL